MDATGAYGLSVHVGPHQPSKAATDSIKYEINTAYRFGGDGGKRSRSTRAMLAGNIGRPCSSIAGTEVAVVEANPVRVDQ